MAFSYWVEGPGETTSVVLQEVPIISPIYDVFFISFNFVTVLVFNYKKKKKEEESTIVYIYIYYNKLVIKKIYIIINYIYCTFN